METHSLGVAKEKKEESPHKRQVDLKKSPHKHVPKKKGLTSACLPLFSSPNAKVCVCVCCMCVVCVCVCVCMYIECRQARHARTHTRRDDVCVRACVCVCGRARACAGAPWVRGHRWTPHVWVCLRASVPGGSPDSCVGVPVGGLA